MLLKTQAQLRSFFLSFSHPFQQHGILMLLSHLHILQRLVTAPQKYSAPGSFQSNSLMLRRFRKTCDNVTLQLPLPTEGGSVVKAYFCSLPCCPLKPHRRCSLLVLHVFTLLCQYYLLQHWCLILLICSNHGNISCLIICFSEALDGALTQARLLCLTNGSGDCVNSSAHCLLLNFIQRE